MKREEEQELKMELIDVIAKERGSMDIFGMKNEVETLFSYFKEASISEEERANDIFLNTSTTSAIYSYKLYPNMELDNRVLFINGVNFALCTIPNNSSEFYSLPLDAKIAYVLSEFEKYMQEDIVYMDEVDTKYTKLGITSIIESVYGNNDKKVKHKHE